MAFGRRLALSNLWLTAPLVERMYSANWRTDAVLRTTTALTVVDAGVKDNVLPTAARARVNFRVHPRDSIAAVEERVRRIVGDPDIEIAAAGTRQEPSPVSPTGGSGFRHLQRTIGEVFPEAIVVPGLVLAGTDSRYYAGLTDQVYRFTPMVLGPDDLARVHGVDERLPVEGYGRCIRFYARLIEQLDTL
ncbi:MAG: M20/M25/M40 family metallo-hydrolase [bacterium]|nr:M20/M25/M40 family metallo-hydrolase [bacterium]